MWPWALVIGMLGNIIYVAFAEISTRGMPSWENVFSVIGQTFGAPALAIFYMTSLALLAQSSTWERRLAPLANVGRMGLTNYLLQTVICTTLFYGYGFGLYGKVGIAAGILLTVVIFALQILFSAWWMKRYRFGPMEWLWRSLTYGKRQPMRS
jgi:uncharacterized protein